MTNLTRFNPNQDFRTFQHQMNRLFEPFLGRVADDESLVSGTWAPPVDVMEEKDAIRVVAELPGMKKEDIEIQFENGVLTIRGQRAIEKDSSDKTFHRVERVYGNFVRSFTLPRSVDADKIDATYRDGVLDVRVPKKEEAKPRQIAINVK
ncbi:MAG TPA: Hsp20/alpha crystallin family protein [Thermoanaerobaculia bacterium]|nr:Hsp20/alpha crystallin family protein [Thermoanaerobaculia bacterium]